MTPIEDVQEMIQNYGYLTIKSSKIYDSFFKLKDDNILECKITFQGILVNPIDKQQINANLRTHFHVYSSVNDRAFNTPALHVSDLNPSSSKPSKVVDDDVEFEILYDPFSVFTLNNDTVISIKHVISQIRKFDITTANGEPVYNVQTTPIVKIKNNTFKQ